MDGGCRLARIVLLATLVAAVAAPAASASQVIEIEIPARGGEISDQQLCGYTGPPRAVVRLPDGYNPANAYPLLVLLKGAGGNYKSTGDARVAAGLGAIVVIPEGCTGWDVDWWNGGRRGSPAWESYFLDQVIPQVRERFRIRPERRYHALAGISMGGLGTAYLGGRLPGFFGSIAIISGLVDGHVYPGEGAAKYAISQGYAGAPPDDPEAVEGPPDGFYSFGHDPVHLAANLRQTRVYMASGDGTPAGADSIGPTMGYNAAAEGTIIRPASDHYAAALQAAGIDFRYDRHAGLHDGPNFDRELKDAIGWGLFAPVDEHPTSWVNDTVATHGKLWQ
jgi:S-formylglutathione hydrolase FrmB